MPGIKAAFVDIGLQQDAFLHFSDIGNRFEEYAAMLEDDDEEEENAEEKVAIAEGSPESPAPAQTQPPHSQHPRSSSHPPRRDNGRGTRRDVKLEKGQDIIVQIIKDYIRGLPCRPIPRSASL
ncbi:MAG: Ribonuclease, partial [Bacteroidetes bacterium]|nr:Ribonuclease [Bacteroidota bacterium]